MKNTTTASNSPKYMLMKNSSSLIAKANEYFDSIKMTFDTLELEQRISSLSDMKEEMMDAGFNATFPEMYMTPSKSNRDEEGAQQDMSKQLKDMRDAANLKRYTYNRTRVALASNKILLNMLRRGKIYDIANYLPYNGAYLDRIVYLGEPAVNAYNHLLRLFSTRPRQEGYIATIVHEGKTINLNIHSAQNLDEKIKKSYGDSAYLLSVKKLVSPPLMQFKSMRIAASVAYALQAAARIYPKLETVNVTYTKEHEAYAAEVSRMGISKDARLDLMEGHEDLKDNLYSKGLMLYENDSLTLLPEIVSSISRRKSEYTSAVVKEAEKQFSYDVFHFFMTEPRRVRSSLSLYPGISVSADPEMYGFLKYSGMKNALDMVQEKIKYEAFSKSGRALGPAIVHLSGVPIEKCAKDFEVNEAEIKAAAEQVSSYKSGVSSQAQQFIEGLNPKKKKE
jgi:hypothetical protein